MIYFMGTKIRLCDAGICEQESARKMLEEGKFPKEIDYQTLLDHGVYDNSTDEIVLTVKSVVFKYKI